MNPYKPTNRSSRGQVLDALFGVAAMVVVLLILALILGQRLPEALFGG